jgi:hypothetical protein
VNRSVSLVSLRPKTMLTSMQSFSAAG